MRDETVGSERVGNSVLTLLGVSIFTAAISVMVFVITLPFGIKPPDGAAGNKWLFSDPLVSTAALMASLAIGCVMTPISYVFLRDRRLALSAPIVLGAVIASILLLTPISGLLGFCGALLTGVAAMAVIGGSSHPSLKIDR